MKKFNQLAKKEKKKKKKKNLKFFSSRKTKVAIKFLIFFFFFSAKNRLGAERINIHFWVYKVSSFPFFFIFYWMGSQSERKQ